jgi:hypothetical protein
MPRKASDKTVTHRIELGITERAKLDEILSLQKENQRIDGITATLQAAGSALAGGGLLWAALAAAAFLAPGLAKKVYNEAKDFADSAVAPFVENVTDPLEKKLKDDIKNAHKNVTTFENDVNLFCTPGANYDEQKCQIARNYLDAAKTQKQEAYENAQAILSDPKQAALEGIKDEYPFIGFVIEGSGLSRLWL